MENSKESKLLMGCGNLEVNEEFRDFFDLFGVVHDSELTAMRYVFMSHVFMFEANDSQLVPVRLSDAPLDVVERMASRMPGVYQELLVRCKGEIESLRRENYRMRDKLHVFERVMSLFEAQSPIRGGELRSSGNRDVVSMLDRALSGFVHFDKGDDS